MIKENKYQNVRKTLKKKVPKQHSTSHSGVLQTGQKRAVNVQ